MELSVPASFKVVASWTVSIHLRQIKSSSEGSVRQKGRLQKRAALTYPEQSSPEWLDLVQGCHHSYGANIGLCRPIIAYRAV